MKAPVQWHPVIQFIGALMFAGCMLIAIPLAMAYWPYRLIRRLVKGKSS
jgi:hypothetical protein